MNGIDFERETQTVNCVCTISDYECDEGFMPSLDEDENLLCVGTIDYAFHPNQVMKSLSTPFSDDQIESVCEHNYHVSVGYRRVAGDTCEGGAGNWEGKTLRCAAGDDTSDESLLDWWSGLFDLELWGMSVTGVIVLVAIALLVLMLLCSSCQTNDGDYFDVDENGDDAGRIWQWLFCCCSSRRGKWRSRDAAIIYRVIGRDGDGSDGAFKVADYEEDDDDFGDNIFDAGHSKPSRGSNSNNNNNSSYNNSPANRRDPAFDQSLTLSPISSSTSAATKPTMVILPPSSSSSSSSKKKGKSNNQANSNAKVDIDIEMTSLDL